MAHGKKAKPVRPTGKSKATSRAAKAIHERLPNPPRARSLDHDRDMTSSFTLRDAARTGHSSALWASNLNLRHRSIGFVRSVDPSFTDPQENLENEPSVDRSSKDDSVLHRVSSESMKNIDSLLHQPIKAPQSEHSTHKTTSLTTPGSQRSTSPTGSSSGEEIVLFRGRTQATTVWEPPPGLPDTVAQPISKSVCPQILSQSSIRIRAPSIPQSLNRASNHENDWESGDEQLVRLDQPPATERGGRRRKAYRDIDDAEIEAVLDEYIANMRESGEIAEVTDVTNVRESGEIAKATDISKTRSLAKPNSSEWGPSEIEDFDDLSTSDGVLEAVQQILSKRHRSDVLQYLVVWEGQSIDEARWIPHSKLSMDGAAVMVESFEAEENNTAEYVYAGDNSADDSDTSDEEDAVDNDDIEISNVDSGDFDDERDLIERRIERLSDEKLARLLAKQEEHGFGADELFLFDDMFVGEDDPEDEDNSGLLKAVASSRRRGRYKRKQRLEFLDGISEVVMFGGDDYGDFDVMDRDRPGLGGVPKRQGDPLTWGLSDSDQAGKLRDAWASDRKKKRLKKQEREELRAQGLLGKKNKFKPDLKTKFNDGLDIDQLGQELDHFLCSGTESRALPPMHKRDRKVIHEIASAFGLTSLSRGSGKSRFPVLQKTSKTIDFDDGMFARLRSKMQRQYYPRMDRKVGRSAVAPRRMGGGSGVSRGDIGYREGEVVGATAPELGAENRGRAMLEKMGWTTGNALGALNNKGILQPIAHVVKNSRAGLG